MQPVSMGVFICSKNINSEVISCNENFLAHLGLRSIDQVMGLTDYDFVWQTYADIYKKHELDTLAGKCYSTIHPCKDSHNREFLAFITKSQQFDMHGKVTGLTTQCCEVVNPAMIELMYLLNKMDAWNKTGNYCITHEMHDNANLTPREQECLFYLLRGKPAKVIAMALNLSTRTIEQYINNLKIKFHCHNKVDLISAAFAKGYFNVIPKSLFSKKLNDTLK